MTAFDYGIHNPGMQSALAACSSDRHGFIVSARMCRFWGPSGRQVLLRAMIWKEVEPAA
jgi:hypothetical protein